MRITNKHFVWQLIKYVLVGMAIGYGIGLLLSFFKADEGVSNYDFQTIYVPETLALLSVVPSFLLFLIIRSRRNAFVLNQRTLQTLARVIEKRDYETEGHCERVAQYAMLLGQSMHVRGKMLWQLGWGAYLHDIGKIAIPDRVLLKPGKLDADEWGIMQTHVKEGFLILEQHTFLKNGMDLVLFHHEKWDGTGYPFGISGEKIPLFARIFTVVDAFDAMTSNRPYRKGMSFMDAKSEIERNAGKHFCPQVVDVFMALPEYQLAQIKEGVKLFPELRPLSAALGSLMIRKSPYTV